MSTFKLDVFEVTVGRFRAFVDAQMGTQLSAPLSGSGANPHLAGTGWNSSWNASLEADTPTLRSKLRPYGTCTWSDSPGATDHKPINCVTWFEAFAFCIWDGGRLPTEAEWNYAAAGGSEQRLYPWGSTAPDDTLAVFCGGTCAAQQVGSRSPTGDGRWGQVDLAGNVAEWILDWTMANYPLPCTDCAYLTDTGSRVNRGGSGWSPAIPLASTFHVGEAPTDRNGANGIRCARNP